MYPVRKSITKFLSITAMLMAMISVSNTANAQLQLGGGLVFGTLFDAIGIQASGIYPLAVNEDVDIDIAGDLTLFLPGDEFGIDVSLFEINGNGHYVFTTTETMAAYALAGLNIAIVKVAIGFDGFGSASASNTEVGLNAGAGAQFDVGFANAYAEAKVVLGGSDQFVIGGGLRFPIGN